VWDADRGTCVYVFSEHSDFVYSVSFNPVDPNLLATGSNDGSVFLWRPSVGFVTDALLAEHRTLDANFLCLAGW
jgi:WD40 repeat protein